ncbi:MAG: hypothetical protein JRH15_04960 [Deltaproteobacteria bacterium]|nr:hypothetical protein [Deltaproteobacteria bacterium]
MQLQKIQDFQKSKALETVETLPGDHQRLNGIRVSQSSATGVIYYIAYLFSIKYWVFIAVIKMMFAGCRDQNRHLIQKRIKQEA